MLMAFLLGLLAAIGFMTVVFIDIMCAKWLKKKIQEKLKNREKHKVAFADSKEVVDDYLKNMANNATEMSMEDLERMCEETPFVAAVVDEDGEITEYEGFKAEEYDANFKTRMKQQKGMIICGV